MDNIRWYINYESLLKDKLYLVEKGNEKLAKARTTAFNVGAFKKRQNLPQIGQQHPQEHPQHQ